MLLVGPVEPTECFVHLPRYAYTSAALICCTATILGDEFSMRLPKPVDGLGSDKQMSRQSTSTMILSPAESPPASGRPRASGAGAGESARTPVGGPTPEPSATSCWLRRTVRLHKDRTPRINNRKNTEDLVQLSVSGRLHSTAFDEGRWVSILSAFVSSIIETVANR